MTKEEIRIPQNPSPDTSCRFTVDATHLPPDASFYLAQRRQRPLGRETFALEGVTAVIISHDQITVNQNGFRDWRKLRRAVQCPRSRHLLTGSRP